MLQVVLTLANPNLRYSKVELLNENLELISDGSESIDSATLQQHLQILDYVVAEGTDNLYIRLVANEMGKNESGEQNEDLSETLTFNVTKASGNSSITAPTTSGNSLAFGAVPVHITSVALADAGDLHTALTDNTLAAAITIQTAANTSTKSDGTSLLKTAIESLNFDVSKDDDSTISTAKLKRVGSSATPMLFSNLAAGETVKIHVADNTQETVTINGVTSEPNVADGDVAGRDDEVESLVAKINAMGFGEIAEVAEVVDGDDDDSVLITAPKGGLSITGANSP